jgi:hypothetical protein
VIVRDELRAKASALDHRQASPSQHVQIFVCSKKPNPAKAGFGIRFNGRQVQAARHQAAPPLPSSP